MFRRQSIWIIAVLTACTTFVGCRTSSSNFSQGSSSGNSSVVLAMTDTPPSLVSILSAEVTLTGATLNPGNVSLFSGSTTVELTRLETDIAYLTTAPNIPAGSYTSLSLTFANPMLTIENDTGSVIGTCAVGSICTMAPTTVANLAATINLSSFSVVANTNTGLLVDVNLDNLLSHRWARTSRREQPFQRLHPGELELLLWEQKMWWARSRRWMRLTIRFRCKM